MMQDEKPKKDSQSRKWQFTINNPIEKGLSREKIKEELGKLKSVVYWCAADEIGTEKNTLHTHIFIACSAPVRFSTLKNLFSDSHIEPAKGTSQQNRDYISKSGKWENDKKHGTSIVGTFEEYGKIPVERQGARNDLANLYDMIKLGASNYQIIEETPEFMFHLDKIERARQTIKAEKYKDIFRTMDVTYIWGETGTGKTRSILEEYGYSNVYRVTDYAHPFDAYKGEDVIVFDEYHSQFKIQDMLNYLDGYPMELPCRYTNKQACYTKTYIISNIDLYEQYPILMISQPNTWNAFVRRIHKIIKFPQDTKQEEALIQECLNGSFWEGDK